MLHASSHFENGPVFLVRIQHTLGVGVLPVRILDRLKDAPHLNARNFELGFPGELGRIVGGAQWLRLGVARLKILIEQESEVSKLSSKSEPIWESFGGEIEILEVVVVAAAQTISGQSGGKEKKKKNTSGCRFQL